MAAAQGAVQLTKPRRACLAGASVSSVCSGWSDVGAALHTVNMLRLSMATAFLVLVLSGCAADPEVNGPSALEEAVSACRLEGSPFVALGDGGNTLTFESKLSAPPALVDGKIVTDPAKLGNEKREIGRAHV